MVDYKITGSICFYIFLNDPKLFEYEIHKQKKYTVSCIPFVSLGKLDLGAFILKSFKLD